MEFLKFTSLGQWELCKADPQKQPKDDYTPKNQTFNVYHNKTGELHADHGRKGSLTGASSAGVQRQMSNNKLKGKVPTKIESQFNDRNPGVGN